MIYKASLDKTAIIITAGITVLFAAIIIGQYPLIRDTGRAAPIFGTIACVVIYAISYAFSPRYYMVTPDELIIRRPLSNVRIKRSDIKRALRVDSSTIGGSIRTFGVGGLFGYYGSFANFSLGRMTWYATRRDTAVLVTTRANKKIVLTPNEPDSLVAELTA
jgi:hypothetical protein